MNLDYEHYPAAQPAEQHAPLIVLHGLLGSSNNWRAICKPLSAQRDVYALDLRNHGRSPHDPNMDLPVMADDILDFIRRQQLAPCIILGHSLGGKVAMQAALTEPAVFDKLIVADIAPKHYPPRHADIFAAVDAINGAAVTSRQQADALIKNILPDQAMRLFLLSNLRRNDDGTFGWRMNIDAIRNHYHEISDAPKPPQPGGQYSKPTLFIKGDQSPYIKNEDMQAIHKLFPAAALEAIPDCGHWVHSEEPEKFLKIVEDFIKNN
jgi:esterase